jgi:hypothetical protein
MMHRGNIASRKLAVVVAICLFAVDAYAINVAVEPGSVGSDISGVPLDVFDALTGAGFTTTADGSTNVVDFAFTDMKYIQGPDIFFSQLSLFYENPFMSPCCLTPATASLTDQLGQSIQEDPDPQHSSVGFVLQLDSAFLGPIAFHGVSFEFTLPTDAGVGNLIGAELLFSEPLGMSQGIVVAPEPSTALLLAFGLVSLAARRRTRA